MADPAPLRCGSYHPGHTVHWIQAQHSRGVGEDPPVEAELLDVRPDGAITVLVDGAQREFWNHEPERLALLAARNNNVVSVQWRWRLLRTASPDGQYVFSICSSEDRRPCPSEPPSGDFFELLTEAGGFSIPAPDLLRSLD